MGFETNSVAYKSNTIARSLQPVSCLDWFSFMVIDLIVTGNYSGGGIIIPSFINTPVAATLWSLRSLKSLLKHLLVTYYAN